MTNSFNYLRSFKLMTEASYPYTGRVSTCKYNAARGVTNVRSYTNVPANNPKALL